MLSSFFAKTLTKFLIIEINIVELIELIKISWSKFGEVNSQVDGGAEIIL